MLDIAGVACSSSQGVTKPLLGKRGPGVMLFWKHHMTHLSKTALAQARKMLDSALQPGAAQKALSMHVESFWQRHGNKVLGLGAALLLYVLW